MEQHICYICHDRRRLADTDTSVVKIGNRSDSETLKETLIRALSFGYLESDLNEHESTKVNSGVCVVSLNVRFDGALEVVSETVFHDFVVICRRCENLLRDFEYHERTSAKIADEIRRFLTKQDCSEGEGIKCEVTDSDFKPVVRKKHTQSLDERQGILAAFRALRKSGISSRRKRGRKRKSEKLSATAASEAENEEDERDLEYEEEEKQEDIVTASRCSKRIQRRREDGLVIRWGDAMFENDYDPLECETEVDDSHASDIDLSRDDFQPRRRRGRKPNKLITDVSPVNKTDRGGQDSTGLKYRCPFCNKYYTPSNSRFHNCTSYKNQLRCHVCNIFFTSYIRLEKHLEVIHLKERQFHCPLDTCAFECISEPAMTMHNHFHFLASCEGLDGIYNMEGSSVDSSLGKVSHGSMGEVTVMDDVQGIVTSPNIADRVSFLLDEKSFLSDGQPINITTDKIKRKVEEKVGVFFVEKDCKNDDRRGEKMSVNTGLASVQTPVGKNFQCPFCDLSFQSKKLIQEHVFEVHKLQVKGESAAMSVAHEIKEMADKYDSGSSDDSVVFSAEDDSFSVKKKLQCSFKGKDCSRKIPKGKIRQIPREQDMTHKVSPLTPDYCNNVDSKIVKNSYFKSGETYSGNGVLHGEIKTKRELVCTKRQHRCIKCTKVFPSSAHLKEHEVSHFKKQPFKCSVCNQGFKRKNALNKHTRLYHPDGQSEVHCTCGKIFASQELMKKHKACSGDHRLLVCSKCGAMYKTQTSLESHMLLHSESKTCNLNSSWPFTCQHCKEKFSSQASLSSHIANSHSIISFRCPECDKVCKTRQLLNQHCARKHKFGSKEFCCPVCRKVFHLLKDLRRHMHSHNPSGMRDCPVCHSKFKTYSTLRAHLKIHTKDKPYDCSVCLLPCPTVDALKIHLLAHHNIKVGNNIDENWDRQCFLCGQIFLRRSGLVCHMKSHFDTDDTELLFMESSDEEVVFEGNPIKNRGDHISYYDVSMGGSPLKEVNNLIPPSCSAAYNKADERILEHVETVKVDVSHKSDKVSVKKPVSSTHSETDNIIDENVVTVQSTECLEVPSGWDEDQSSSWSGALGSSDTQCIEAEDKAHNSKNYSCTTHVSVNMKAFGSSTNDETKYICGSCTLVFTDVTELQTHLLTCYKQDGTDDYIVVFEVDDDVKSS